MAEQHEYVLTATCNTASGIVAAVSQYLATQGCYIAETHQFDDIEGGRLFMRVRFLSDQETGIDELQRGFETIATPYDMNWQIRSASRKVRTIIMVSKFDHCLEDLLYRLRKGELNMDVMAVVSNHQDLRSRCESEGFPYLYLPVTPDNKNEQENKLWQLWLNTGAELIVLARYMQVLTDDFCSRLPGQIINIHHSFLPGFKGAKPYHQAHERGVKLIGATAHYVTSDLDEGPIISQAVQEVDHTFTPKMLVATGRDTETRALARAVQLHCEQRVFLDGMKTVVFK